MGFKTSAGPNGTGGPMWKDAQGNDSPGFTTMYNALTGNVLASWANPTMPPPPPGGQQQNQPAQQQQQQQQAQSPQSAELAAAAAASGSGNKALLGV